MLVMDPPDHTRVRKLVNKAFTPRRIAALRGRIEAIVDELLAPVRHAHGRRSTRSAAPLPAIVIAELLGVPAEDHRRFKAWAAEIVAGDRPADVGGAPGRGRRRCRHLFGYLSEIIAARRAEPRDDLISAMVQAQEEARRAQRRRAARHQQPPADRRPRDHHQPDRQRPARPAARARPSSSACAATCAVADRDRGAAALRRAGAGDAARRARGRRDRRPRHRGGLARCWSASAPRTTIPTCFDEPERLDVGRDPNPHLAFGFGAHFCLGAPLARLEGEVALGRCSSASRAWRWRPRRRRIAPTRCCAAWCRCRFRAERDGRATWWGMTAAQVGTAIALLALNGIPGPQTRFTSPVVNLASTWSAASRRTSAGNRWSSWPSCTTKRSRSPTAARPRCAPGRTVEIADSAVISFGYCRFVIDADPATVRGYLRLRRATGETLALFPSFGVRPGQGGLSESVTPPLRSISMTDRLACVVQNLSDVTADVDTELVDESGVDHRVEHLPPGCWRDPSPPSTRTRLTSAPTAISR